MDASSVLRATRHVVGLSSVGRAELVLEPMGGHLELHRADRGQHRGLVTEVLVAQHLHHALLVELGDAATELLEPTGVLHASDDEVLGRELGQPRELDGRVEVERVADRDVRGVDQADHVARPRLVDRVALLPEHGVGVLGGEGLAGGPVGDDHPPLEAARAHAHERDAIAVRWVHVRLHLEGEGRERRVERARHAVRRRHGAPVTGARSTTASSRRRTPKLVRAEPKNTGRHLALAEPIGVGVGAHLVEQPELVGGRRPGVALLDGRQRPAARAPRPPRWRRGPCG